MMCNVIDKWMRGKNKYEVALARLATIRVGCRAAIDNDQKTFDLAMKTFDYMRKF